MEKFKATYEVSDGYMGGSRPQYVSISADDFDEETSEEELREMYCDIIQADFDNKISWYSDDEDKFVRWAQEQQGKRHA